MRGGSLALRSTSAPDGLAALSRPPHRLTAVSLALYRRYRPATFAEVIGQEHVTEPLQQALRNNRVHHAYLFSGPRGCGKTTSARILARCLNCEQGPTPEPVRRVPSRASTWRPNGPGSIDVDRDRRRVATAVSTTPATCGRRRSSRRSPSRYKIYIIDEAHMVSPQGFNALLKLVEEPPEHLKFIFATTEPEKVIADHPVADPPLPVPAGAAGDAAGLPAPRSATDGGRGRRARLPAAGRAGRALGPCVTRCRCWTSCSPAPATTA